MNTQNSSRKLWRSASQDGTTPYRLRRITAVKQYFAGIPTVVEHVLSDVHIHNKVISIHQIMSIHGAEYESLRLESKSNVTVKSDAYKL